MRRPVVLWFVVVFGWLAAVSNLLGALGALAVAGQRPLSEVLGHAAISSAVAAASVWVARSLTSKSFRSTLPVSVYLWGMLIVYPVSNVLRTAGLYLPMPEFADDERWGAAAAEFLRYLVILSLIVWVGFSKALRSHLAEQSLVTHAEENRLGSTRPDAGPDTGSR